MGVDVVPLADAIDRYIAKADEDLKETLEEEGYIEAGIVVAAINALEDAVNAALEMDADEFIAKVKKAEAVEEFLQKVWPDMKVSVNLEEELRKIFRKHFDELMHQFTFQWLFAEDPVLASAIDEVIDLTKPAEAFIKGWSGKLAELMHLSTKDAMERILLKASRKNMTIDEVADEIANSGIRQCGYRSRRVALTEVLRVESYAQQESMVQNPSAYKKRWVHVMSAQPRENHIAIDGQEVFKRDPFTLVGRDGSTYYPMCPRDTSLPAAESVNCHCLMESVTDDKILGMSDEERVSLRKKYMDEINTEYDAWEQKFKEDNGIEEARDDPSITWEIYNSYYEAYRKGEIK